MCFAPRDSLSLRKMGLLLLLSSFVVEDEQKIKTEHFEELQDGVMICRGWQFFHDSRRARSDLRPDLLLSCFACATAVPSGEPLGSPAVGLKAFTLEVVRFTRYCRSDSHWLQSPPIDLFI